MLSAAGVRPLPEESRATSSLSGLKTTAAGQRFLEGFQAVQAFGRGMSLCGDRCLDTDPSWPVAVTVRAQPPLPWSPWQQG